MSSVSTALHIAAHFQLESPVKLARPFGQGHINDTFMLETENGNAFILQRINTQVFKDPDVLAQNIDKVTQHVWAKMQADELPELDRRCVQIIPSRDGDSFFKTEDQSYWRILNFISGTKSLQFVQDPQEAFEAAKAFGQFQKYLMDLPVEGVGESIPDFHNISLRFEQLRTAIKQALPDRLSQAGPELTLALEYEALVQPIQEAWEAGTLARRITHNDTKLNNVLLDAQSGEGMCVIDLDTLMPGAILYDFGDMIRTFISPVAEDEQDLSLIRYRTAVFESLAKGYLEEVGPFLSEIEWQLLVRGGVYMTLMMAIRFLADFLKGDPYYKVNHPRHNLDRCRNQLALIAALLEHEEEMESFVRLLK